jgi:hypothetical protein
MILEIRIITYNRITFFISLIDALLFLNRLLVINYSVRNTT